MSKLILIMLFVGGVALHPSNKWELVKAEVGNVMTIYSLDSSTVYLLTDKRSPNLGERFTDILLSKDTGKNWTKIYSYNHRYTDNRPHKLQVLDSTSIFYVSGSGYVNNSKDGGKTFEFRQIPEGSINFSSYFREVCMLTPMVGIIGYGYHFITYDRWKSYLDLDSILNFEKGYVSLEHPIILDDSTIAFSGYDYNRQIGSKHFFAELNLFSLKYSEHTISNASNVFRDMIRSTQNTFFLSGKERTLSGGSGNDVIYKSSDGGKTWRNVLDLYDDYKTNDNRTPFGLQSIAFRDSLVGIAVGQFGKFVYTYDGGETWIYETELHPTVKSTTPATMLIRYAGDTPIVGTIGGEVYRLLEDNLAPKAEDIYTISGRVWLDSVTGQAGIPVALGARICMTDSLGFYRFTRVAPGQHTVRALNKYFDGPNPEFYYKPYDYTPAEYNILVSSDTSGFDFNAIDLLVGVERFADKFTCDLHINDNLLNINILSNDYLFSEVSIISSTGVELSQHKFTSPYSTIPIDQLSTGIYFAKVTINNQYTQLKKFVILK